MSAEDPAARPLRLLLLTNTAWSRNLGAARVMVEIGEEYARLGHHVEKLSREDLFPSPRPGHGGSRRSLRRIREIAGSYADFSARAATRVQETARTFDVIEACQPDLAKSKAELGFPGLLVTRTVMNLPAYEEFEAFARRRWPRPFDLRRILANLLTLRGRRRQHRQARLSLRFADVVNVASSDDVELLARNPALRSKLVRFPLGLGEGRRRALREGQASTADRLKSRMVVFIGSWNERKGARDWPEIAGRLLARVPDARIRLLGTTLSPADVLRHFESSCRAAVQVVPAFDSGDLPRLLADATVGAFPGYFESFGFGVLEKLTAGLPTVAYDAPGARDVLRDLKYRATAQTGSVSDLVELVISLLNSDPERYEECSRESSRVADGYRWEEIARDTIAHYRKCLRELRSDRGA